MHTLTHWLYAAGAISLAALAIEPPRASAKPKLYVANSDGNNVHVVDLTLWLWDLGRLLKPVYIVRPPSTTRHWPVVSVVPVAR